MFGIELTFFKQFSTALKQESVRKIEKKTILNESTKNIKKVEKKIKKTEKSTIKKKEVDKKVATKIIKSEKNDTVKKLSEPKITSDVKKDSVKNNTDIHHNATWYRTEGTRVHKDHPDIHGTAAYNFVPRGTKLLITNPNNNKSCIVEVTDRMGKKSKNYIDLSHKAFGAIANHGCGKILVLVKILY